MNNIGLVIEREYKTRVFKRSFILMTILIPFLFVIISVLPAVVINLSAPSQETIAVLDHTGQYVSLFKDTESYRFIQASHSLDEYKRSSTDSVEISAVLEIRQNLLEDPKAVSLFSYKTLPSGVEKYINSILSDYLTDQVIDSYDIPEFRQRMKDAEIRINVPTFRWDKNGEESISSGSVASIFGMVLSMFIYIFLLLYGSMVLQSVMEEKKNRIMEVMLSSIRPFDLMIGKIIGVGLVGLTQLVLWIALFVGFILLLPLFFPLSSLNPNAVDVTHISSTGLEIELIQTMKALSSLNYLEIIPLVFFYFVGGYLLYASILVSLGSTVSTEEDAGQMMLPMMMLMMLSFYVGVGCIGNPESSMAFWCSFIPFTAPMVMMVRLSYGVPLWQEILSLLVLYGSFILTTYLGAKIYRVGILMYGKKPSLREIWRWLRY